MSYYPTLPDEDFSSSSAPPSNNVFQFAQNVESDDNSSMNNQHQDSNQDQWLQSSYSTQNQNNDSQFQSSYSNQDSNFNVYSNYGAPLAPVLPPAPSQGSAEELEYAPPLHTLPPPPTSRVPPQWVPACIPNPDRVSYDTPCYITCGRNGLYLNVNQVIHDCPVNVWTKISSLQQKWYFTKDGYIELAADRTFVLDCKNVAVGAQLVVSKKKISPSGNPVDQAIISQKWNIVSVDRSNYICNVLRPNLVVELAGSTINYDKGDLVRINTNLSTGNDHQKWNIHTTSTGQTKDANLIPVGSKCYIYGAQSKLYLTVKVGLLGKVKAGAQVYVSKGKMLSGAKSQQWIFDKDGFLVSALDKTGNLVLDCRSGQCGEELILNTRQFTNNLNQKWLVKQPTTAISEAKEINLKACRFIYTQLNTNLLLDEKGVNEPVFLNFSTNSATQVWKVKTV